MTTRTRILILIEQVTEAPEPERAEIETTGELVRARPIRKVPTVPPSRGLSMQLGKLNGWLAKRSA